MAGPNDEDDFELDDDIDVGVDHEMVDEDIDGAEDEAEEERQTETIDARAAQTPRQPSRGEKRFQTLASETKAARAEAAELRRKLEEVERRQTAPAPIDPRIEAERLAMMTPEERMDYRLEQAERRHQQQLAQIQFQTLDQMDRSEFQAQIANNPKLARWADEVEAELAKLRAQGQNVKRSVMASYIIGQKVLKQDPKATAKQKAAGQARIAAQKTSPGSSKGDASRGARGGKSLEDRLADQLI
jgi:hypothetical protein